MKGVRWYNEIVTHYMYLHAASFILDIAISLFPIKNIVNRCIHAKTRIKSVDQPAALSTLHLPAVLNSSEVS